MAVRHAECHFVIVPADNSVQQTMHSSPCAEHIPWCGQNLAHV